MDSVKIALLGAAGVGKSALAVRSITGRFLHHYDPTLEDEYHCEVSVNGQLRSVALMDTAGQESNQLEFYLNWAHVIVVAFSIDSRTSLDYATQLLQYSCSSRPPAILLGSKQDLKGKREVSFEEAQKLADGLNVPYMETSAAADYNVKEAFVLATEMGLFTKNQINEVFSDSLFEDSGYLSSMEKKEQQKPPAKRFVKGLLKKWKDFRKEKKLLESLVYPA